LGTGVFRLIIFGRWNSSRIARFPGPQPIERHRISGYQARVGLRRGSTSLQEWRLLGVTPCLSE
jgi:hypothetical protein